MKYFISIILVILLLACEVNESNVENNLTGNEVSYVLYQGSDYNVSGEVVIQETKDKTALINLSLSGTASGLVHPVHLHYDDIASDGEIAAILNPIDGTTGASTTQLTALRNSKPITYKELLKMESSIKVHLSDTEPGKYIILSGGNVGKADLKANPFGRVEISVCKSN